MIQAYRKLQINPCINLDMHRPDAAEHGARPGTDSGPEALQMARSGGGAGPARRQPGQTVARPGGGVRTGGGGPPKRGPDQV